MLRKTPAPSAPCALQSFLLVLCGIIAIGLLLSASQDLQAQDQAKDSSPSLDCGYWDPGSQEKVGLPPRTSAIHVSFVSSSGSFSSPSCCLLVPSPHDVTHLPEVPGQFLPLVPSDSMTQLAFVTLSGPRKDANCPGAPRRMPLSSRGF